MSDIILFNLGTISIVSISLLVGFVLYKIIKYAVKHKQEKELEFYK